MNEDTDHGVVSDTYGRGIRVVGDRSGAVRLDLGLSDLMVTPAIWDDLDQRVRAAFRPALLDAGETMTVTVRDRSAEAAWGNGPTKPVTRTVTISAFCQVPDCGQRRGEPGGLSSHDDGASYWVQVWANPCGHVDSYADVVEEASQRGGLGAVRVN
jgi:hypothetical protein